MKNKNELKSKWYITRILHKEKKFYKQEQQIFIGKL